MEQTKGAAYARQLAGQGIPEWLVASTGLSHQHNMTVWKYLQVSAGICGYLQVSAGLFALTPCTHMGRGEGLIGKVWQGIGRSMAQGISEWRVASTGMSTQHTA